MSAGMGRGGAEWEIVFVSILFPQSVCACVRACVRVKGGLYACMCNKSALIRCERGGGKIQQPRIFGRILTRATSMSKIVQEIQGIF